MDHFNSDKNTTITSPLLTQFCHSMYKEQLRGEAYIISHSKETPAQDTMSQKWEDFLISFPTKRYHHRQAESRKQIQIICDNMKQTHYSPDFTLNPPTHPSELFSCGSKAAVDAEVSWSSSHFTCRAFCPNYFPDWLHYFEKGARKSHWFPQAHSLIDNFITSQRSRLTSQNPKTIREF